MDELVSAILALIIVLFGLSLVVSPLMGRPDCFFLLRPIGKRGKNFASGFIQGISSLFHKGAKALLKEAGTCSILMRLLLLYPVAIAFIIIGGIFSIIAEIVFGGKKR